jgi:ankyrin repeat protein
MREDDMRCHILNCLAALCMVQIEKDKIESTHADEHELVKRKVFAETISMIISSECERDEDPILSFFPDDDKMCDDRSWLPMHCAIALTLENKISEEDIHLLYAADPLAMHLFSGTDEDEDMNEVTFGEEGGITGYTPIHLLCMQKRPNISLVEYFCVRDEKAFLICNRSGKSSLHIVAQYSESLEVLQKVLSIDHTLTRRRVDVPGGIDTTPLGLLCGRIEFPSFHDMFSCLIESDSSVVVIFDGIISCINQYKDSSCQDMSPGSRGYKTVAFLGELLSANSDVASGAECLIFHMACRYLSGELCIAVLSLFLSKNNDSIHFISGGRLPIHIAAANSTLDVLKFLLKAYPESLTMVSEGEDGKTLLHLAQYNETHGASIVEYLCNLCPALIHVKCAEGQTPLHCALLNDMQSVQILCNADGTVVRDKRTPPDSDDVGSGQLPLHLLIKYQPPKLEISEEGDCFRLFLRLYLASAGIKDGHLNSPYDLAIQRYRTLSVYFIRLLLSADPTIDPVKRHNLNYEARREGMFLAFRALSTNLEPTIWTKIREQRDLLARVMSYL